MENKQAKVDSTDHGRQSRFPLRRNIWHNLTAGSFDPESYKDTS
jgi:hypothetical protein